VFSVALSPALGRFCPGPAGLVGGLGRGRRRLLCPGTIQSTRILVPGFFCGGPLMRQSRPSSRPQRAQRLCKVTILVPEYCAEGIRQFARELRARHQAEPAPTRFEWRALSPSAELMVSPERSVRCAVRDTRAPGPDRFCWTVAILGQLEPVAKGRAKSRGEARLLAEAALAAYFADWDEPALVQM
jgi:hypothetical protein